MDSTSPSRSELTLREEYKTEEEFTINQYEHDQKLIRPGARWTARDDQALLEATQ